MRRSQCPFSRINLLISSFRSRSLRVDSQEGQRKTELKKSDTCGERTIRINFSIASFQSCSLQG